MCGGNYLRWSAVRAIGMNHSIDNVETHSIQALSR
jgi:hypothetical protein